MSNNGHTKLGQIMAVINSEKPRLVKELTNLYQTSQKADLFSGFSRVYKSLLEDGDSLPPEVKRVQKTVSEVVTDVVQVLTRHFNLTATKDWANVEAKADVVIDGKVFISQAPSVFLIFLEKQLIDLNTFINSLPVLDATDEWTKDSNSGLFTTAESWLKRTQKVPKTHVLYAATKEHPAQAQMYHEDVEVGRWTVKKFSGAISAAKKKELLHRVAEVTQSVKFAREEANSHFVVDQKVSEMLLEYIFKGI